MTDPLPHSLAALRGPLRPIARVLLLLDTAAGWAIVGLLTAMVAIVAAQVLLRYVFNDSLGWADELSRLTFVWSIFLAIPLGIRPGVHIGMEVVTARLPARLRDALARATALGAAALMALVAWQAVVVATDQWDEKMASVEASAAWFLVAIAVGCTHALLHLLLIVADGKPAAAGAVATE